MTIRNIEGQAVGWLEGWRRGKDSNPRVVAHYGRQAGRCLNQRRPLHSHYIKTAICSADGRLTTRRRFARAQTRATGTSRDPLLEHSRRQNVHSTNEGALEHRGLSPVKHYDRRDYEDRTAPVIEVAVHTLYLADRI